MLKLSPCGCGAEFLVRIERSWWMRVFTWKRLYFCTQCRRRLFIARPRTAAPGATLPPTLAARRAEPGSAPAPLAPSANGTN
jgi:hypothetical protein